MNNEPRVVKFSGGRSSGMMLMKLLEGNQLDASRGDVILFNNTSAEHPATYEFTRKIKQIAEQDYNIPFFWTEYQTYEDAAKHQWVRKPTYRLVNDTPYNEKDNPDGYRYKGEVFEMLISHTGHVPNMMTRTCTQYMKIFITNAFLADWFAGKPAIKRLGHYGDKAKMTDSYMLDTHKNNGGGIPDDILLKKRERVRTMPFVRKAQYWADYTKAATSMDNPDLNTFCLGGKAQLYGEKALSYISYIGIRKDEEIRLKKIRARVTAAKGKGGKSFTNQPTFENVKSPLVDDEIGKDEVLTFWRSQSFNLDLPESGIFSNCVYCPLKGKERLIDIAKMDGLLPNKAPTPASIDWWIDIEKRYSRDLIAEKRKTTTSNKFVGFFGAVEELVYPQIKQAALDSKADVKEAEYLVDEDYVPCNCTD